jgi:hypothetical protein
MCGSGVEEILCTHRPLGWGRSGLTYPFFCGYLMVEKGESGIRILSFPSE